MPHAGCKPNIAALAYHIVTGLSFAVGGTKKMTLLAGIAVIFSAVLVIRYRTPGVLLFELVTVAAVAWTVSDPGLEFWQLISRLLAFVVLSYLLVRRPCSRRKP